MQRHQNLTATFVSQGAKGRNKSIHIENLNRNHLCLGLGLMVFGPMVLEKSQGLWLNQLQKTRMAGDKLNIEWQFIWQ